jgi:hypothetical protein
MGIFRKREIEVKASEGTHGSISSAGAVSLASASVGAGRARAMQIPTVSRARDLLSSLVGSLPIRNYGTQWNGEDLEEIPLPPEPWMIRPDPRTTRAHMLAWTFDDLLFYGRAYWLVTSRYSTGFPATFQWLPAELVTFTAQRLAGNVPISGYSIQFEGSPLRERDVVVFYGPNDPVLLDGTRAIRTAERLDRAAERFANTPAAFGWLRQTAGEPMSGDELADLAAAWAAARDDNAIAALNEFVEWNESQMDPTRLQLLEARQHQALELARVMNVSPFLVGAPSGGSMTYQNAQMAQAQLAIDAGPYIDVIEQTLSADSVTPRGHIVRLDRSVWLEHAQEAPAMAPEETEEAPA